VSKHALADYVYFRLCMYLAAVVVVLISSLFRYFFVSRILRGCYYALNFI
jgi:hypothetical protein